MLYRQLRIPAPPGLVPCAVSRANPPVQSARPGDRTDGGVKAPHQSPAEAQALGPLADALSSYV